MKLMLLILWSLIQVVYAQERATHQSLTDLSEFIRDPVFTSTQRREFLEFTRKMMVKKLAEEMKVSENELNHTFMKNPVKMNVLMDDPWIDLETQFYTTLHQENFNQRWNDLQRFVKFTDYGKSIYQTMMGHLGNYSPVAERKFYLRWHKMGLVSEGRTRTFNIPYFLMSKNINDLIRLEAHVPYEELIKKIELQTFLAKTSSLSRKEKQELAEKMELNRRIHKRAIVNSAKTIGSIHYISGLNNRYMTENRISSFVHRNCDGCSSKEKSDFIASAMKYLDTIKKITSYNGAADIARNFCESLRKNDYHWNVDKLKPTPTELLIDNTKIINYYTVHKLKKKNAEAIAKTVLDQDLGILFITDSINHLDKSREPVATRLECTKFSTITDSRLVHLAIQEAERNVEEYMNVITKRLNNSVYNLIETNSLVEYFVQTNQAASIEATSAFPQGIGWVLKSLAELDQNSSRRAKVDSVVMWGGTILGIGLTLTGVGAPEGVAIILTSIGVVKGIAAGSYYYVRSTQEKSFAKEMQLSKNAGSGLSQDNIKGHYATYRTLKIYYIKEFGQSAFNFVGLHKALMNRTGDVGKTHSILRRVFETIKATGKDTAIETIQDMVLEMAVAS